MTAHALLLDRNPEKELSVTITTLPQAKILEQEGDTLIKVIYSTINYKDALALTGKSPVVRLWPMVPGIDGVGTVVSSQNPSFKEGDHVILNGWGCGETHWGCYSQYAHLKSEWLIRLPSKLTPWQAMAIGTAGYTAGLCVQRILAHGIKPEQGPVLVTGSTGGVGSIAIALLSKLGYTVTASTSKINDADYLKSLGASDILNSSELSAAGKPLQKEQWAAVVDALGSHTLANACAQTQYGGIVAACGLAQGLDFPATVAPFILRGVTLAGVDSVMAPIHQRVQAWELLSTHLDHEILSTIAQTVTLADVQNIAQKMIAGEIKGRFVVDVNS